MKTSAILAVAILGLVCCYTAEAFRENKYFFYSPYFANREYRVIDRCDIVPKGQVIDIGFGQSKCGCRWACACRPGASHCLLVFKQGVAGCVAWQIIKHDGHCQVFMGSITAVKAGSGAMIGGSAVSTCRGGVQTTISC